MGRFYNTLFTLLTVIMLFSANVLKAQITTPNNSKEVDGINFKIYVFCADRDDPSNGELTVKNPMGEGSATFTWEKMDTLTGAFIPYNGIVSYEDTLQSTITQLTNGLYKATVNIDGVVTSYQAYVLNYWIDVTQAEIPDSTSNCDGFWLNGNFEQSPLVYYDASNTPHDLSLLYGAVTIKWFKEGEWLFSSLQPFSDPIASDDPIDYSLEITNDEFGCSDKETTEYYSKIPKSDFTADPMSGEAVLEVTFSNKSINYDSILWCFYKNDSIIKAETAENKDGIVDSIDFILYDDAPVYEYEWSGLYKVKLVTVKINDTTGNCRDTLYMSNYITVENALVKVPNVFTPNGDGVNDEFVVRTQSLKSMKIKIFNRWGGVVHSWSYSNIRGRDYTYKHSVWDGRVNGGRMASPGVYFYIISAVGRDGSKQKIDGFFHLFRDKN